MTEKQAARKALDVKNSWATQKNLNELTVVRQLFFTTFTTTISVLIARGSLLADSRKLIDAKLLLASLLIFYFSAIFWFFANLIFSLKLPSIISASAGPDAYIGAIKGTLSDSQKDNWDELELHKTSEWNIENYDRSILARRLIALVQVVSLALYGYGCFLLFQATHQFLYRSILD